MRILSLSFFAGALILLAFSELPDTHFVVIPSGIALAGLLLLYFKRPRKIIFPLILACSGFLCAYWQASQIIQSRIPQQLEGKDLLVNGVIEGIPVYTDNSARFVLNINHAEPIEPHSQIGKKITGKVRISWYRDFPQTMQAGDHWQLQIRAKQPNGFMNPGGMDYEKWLFTQKVMATAYVRRSENNQYLGTGAAGATDRLREHIITAIQGQLGETPSGAIISALAVAWRNDISTPQWETLRRTGTSHLVAISGLHIGLVAGFGYLMTRLSGWLFPAIYLMLPARIAGGLTGGVLAFAYALLAGFTLPTQRALLMVLIIMVGLLYRRSIPFTTIFCCALLGVLLLDPLAPLSPGFWLSFLSVLMIFLLSQRNISRDKKWLVLIIQVGLSIGLIPLTASFFGSVSLVSAPANLIAVPFVSLLVVPLVLLGVVMLVVNETVAGWLWQLASYALDGLFRFLDYLAHFEQAALHLPQLPLLWVLIAVAGFLLLILPRGIPGKWLGLVFMAPAFVWQAERPTEDSFSLTVLDVGQGLASVVQTANHVLVFDTGPKPSANFDAGRLVVLPWLHAQGYQTVDTLIVSHADNDHSGGAKAILDTMPAHRFLTNSEILFYAYQPEPCLAGKRWQWDGVQFEIIHPATAYQHKKRNNRSCVLKVSNNQHSVLLAADIERPAEYTLSKQPGDALKSDVILVPHHGSKSSSSPALLKKVEPELAIVTAGYRNRFHHPHPSVVKRYKSWGIPLLNTATHGAIRLDFRAGKQAIAIHKYRESHRKFWNR